MQRSAPFLYSHKNRHDSFAEQGKTPEISLKEKYIAVFAVYSMKNLSFCECKTHRAETRAAWSVTECGNSISRSDNMAIGCASDEGSIVKIFDESGNQTGYVYKSEGDRLMGYSSSSISIDFGNIIRIYDERGNETGYRYK